MTTERVDEVEIYYTRAKRLECLIKILFWITASVSLVTVIIPGGYINADIQSNLNISFVTLVILHFVSNLFLSYYFLPYAERKRLKQLLSNAFATPLTQENTHLYYNNTFPPSIAKLGANVMENAFFGKAITEKMLFKERVVNITYLIIWFTYALSKNSDLGIVVWLTQFLFSAAILSRWLGLELLRYRYEQTYELLYSTFLSGNSETNKFTAKVLEAFAAYESAKSAATVILSTRVFQALNDDLTKKWSYVRANLKMDAATSGKTSSF
jgi:hypothetical protein